MGVKITKESCKLRYSKIISWPLFSLLIFCLLASISWAVVLNDSNLGAFFSGSTVTEVGDNFRQIYYSYISSQSTPAFLSYESWYNALFLSFRTLLVSILAIGLAGLVALITFASGARNLAMEGKSPLKKPFASLVFYLLRVLYTVTRSVPELIWAMLIVFTMQAGIVAGALALAIHNFGILGRLCSEVVENMDQRSIRSLRSSGASSGQIILYGVFPEVLPQLLTYILYRWEVVIRTTVVVGFIAAEGLGRQFRLSMSWFHYDEVIVLLTCYVVLVLIVDAVSGCLRKMAS